MPSLPLTPNQQRAVTHVHGPMQILAGPGSGKTEVMTRRVAHLINDYGVSPEQILCITFTRKAAEELKDRIHRLVGVEQSVEEMQVSTVHSFCQSLIDQYIDLLPVNRNFRVLDRNTQFLYVYNRRYQLKLNFPKSRKGRFLNKAIRFFNDCTEEMVDPDHLIASFEKRLKEAEEKEDRAAYKELLGVAEAYKRYIRYLFDDNLLDFGHLQKLAYQMLTDYPEVLEEVRGTYRFVQVDEYQDTNPIQAELFYLVAGDGPDANITVVGDDDQSIYRFRGATPRNLKRFTEVYPQAKTITLDQNFRSTQKIVRFTSGFIRDNVDSRLPKELTTDNEEGNFIQHIHGENVADSALKLAEYIYKLKEEGYVERWGDIAVLFRSVRRDSQELMTELLKREIPYIVEGDRKLFKRRDIKAYRSLLLFLSDKKPKIATLAQPVVGFSEFAEEQITEMKGRLSDSDQPEIETLKDDLNNKDAQLLEQLLELRKSVRNKNYDDVTSVFFRLLEITDYFERSLNEGNEKGLQNLGAFSQVIYDFDDIARRTTLNQFEWYLRWLGDDSMDEANPVVEDALQIMTVHQAKGLEFPVTIIGSLLENRFPGRYYNSDFEIPKSLRKFKEETNKKTHYDDERRLFYVGSTRAKNLLVLSSADKIRKRGHPSRFLDEMPQRLMQTVDTESPSIEQMKVGQKRLADLQRLSYSTLAYYLFCPLRYKLMVEYEFKVPQLTKAFYGASVHQALAELHENMREGSEIDPRKLEAIYERNWIPLGNRARNYEDELKAKGLKVFKNYYEEYSGQLNNVFEVEQRFAIPHEKALVVGRIDLLKQKEAGLEIVDFKTSKQPHDQIVSPELQLNIYALYIHQQVDQPVETLTLHYLDDNRQVHCRWDENVKQETKESIEKVIDGITEENFEPKAGGHCQYCEFKNVCVYAET